MQDAVLSCADEPWEAMGRDAMIFVSGNAGTTAPGVRNALTEVVREKTGSSEADAQAWLAGLPTTDRFVEDIWEVEDSPAIPGLEARSEVIGAAERASPW